LKARDGTPRAGTSRVPDLTTSTPSVIFLEDGQLGAQLVAALST